MYEPKTLISHIEIHNLLGEIVLQSKLLKELDITRLNNGIYLVKIFDQERKLFVTEVLIKE